MPGSARVPRVGFGVAPKQAFPTHRGGPYFRNPEKFVIARTRARSPEANRLRGCPLRPE
jgi:hypothetical protein